MRRATGAQRRENQFVENPARYTRNQHRDQDRRQQGQLQKNNGRQGSVSPEHKHGTMRQIENVEHAKDQCKSKSEESINPAQRDGIDDLLSEHPLFLNDVSIIPGHHDDGGLHGVISGGLAVAASDLAKFERPGCAGPLSPGQSIAQRYAISFEPAAEFCFRESLGHNVHGIVRLRGKLIGERTVGLLVTGDKSLVFRSGVFDGPRASYPQIVRTVFGKLEHSGRVHAIAADERQRYPSLARLHKDRRAFGDQSR